MGQASPHQNLELLRAFGEGKVSGAAAETIAQHLGTCLECRNLVDDVPANKPSAADTPEPPGKPPPVAPVPAAPEPIPAALANSPDYEVLREISRGGMGVVYLARNRRMDRLEGLKVVNGALLKRAGAHERFEREMRAAARLNHSNIVTAYSSPPLEGLLAFAMEFVDGTDLHELVKSRGPLPVSNACYYITQAARGLQHAFEREMVHRDIKPNNLMLTVDGKKQVVKILDFGLAKATSENPVDAGLTREGQMLGTPHYMAPEQIVSASKADIRADIYSLGCTLIYLLTGDPPFGGKESLFEILAAHQIEVPRPLNEVRADVPVELAAIVSKMTGKDPAQRYSQPAEIAQVLAPFFKQGIKAIPAGEGRFAAASAVKPPPDTLKSKTGDAAPAAVEPAVSTRASSATPAKPASAATDPLPTSVEPLASGQTTRHPGDRRRHWRPQVGVMPMKMWIGLAAAAVVLGILGLWAGGAFAPKEPVVVETGRPQGDDAEEPPSATAVLPQLMADNQEAPDDEGMTLPDALSATETIEDPAPSEVATEQAADSPENPPEETETMPETAESAEPTQTPVADITEPGAGDRRPEVLKAAKKTRDDDVRKAEKALLSQFDKELAVLAKSRIKPEDKLHLVNAVKAEKAAFESRKLIPWSPLMRNAVLAYLKELATANLTIRKAYDRHISTALKAKDQAVADQLRAEMHQAAPRELLGTWICSSGNRSWTWNIFSDGTFDFHGLTAKTGDEWLWALNRTFLVVSTRHAKDPRTQFIDRCVISADGTIFTAENNRKDRFSGRLERGGY